MNKKAVDALLPRAYTVLREVGIAKKDGTIPKAFRGQIASFGSAISMGSLLAAVAFYSQQGNSSVDRSLLMQAIYQLMTKSTDSKSAHNGDLFNYIKDQKDKEERTMKEQVVNVCVALKLAMNLYKLEDSDGADRLAEGAAT